MVFMAVLYGITPQWIYGTEEDVQRMDCENNNIFAITTDVNF